MLKESRAGAAALLAAPLIVIASAIIAPTVSDDAAKRYTAIVAHRGVVIASNALSLIALALLVAGTIWLALACAPRARRLALAGGIIGVLGTLVVFFEQSIAAAMPAVVGGLDPTRAAAAVHRVSSAGAVAALEPVSLLQAIGLAVLGLAAVRAGAARWAGMAIAAGAFANEVGFATGTKPLVIAGFVVLFIGLAVAVRALVARPRPEVASSVRPGSASALVGEQALSA
jgi:hypothetical protein